ncbi:hypothetical protein [Streptomyces sp. NPDC005251]|uniref:hypothetical protein n=1 Tax=unclassified Streptomyces TaxID=2593676 RepID=UPI0033A2364A
MAFSESKFRRGREKSFERLNRYRGLRAADNPALHAAMTAFYDQVRFEGREINAGRQPVANTQVVHNLVRELQKKGAFSVRARWWLDNQNKDSYSRNSKWEAALEKAGAEHVRNTGAWSKTTGMPAELRAELNNGRTLESAPGAAILDGLDTGHDRATPSPSMNYMWGEASQTFMAESRGTVHADVYRGVDENSVLKTIEMPELLNKMERGEVDGVTFHVRRRNQQTAVLDEVATYTVRSQNSWDQVMTLDRTPSYSAEQNREYQTQQVARSILRNRQGIQQSLDGFRGILDNANRDPDQAVFVTGAGAEFPHSTATREQIAGWERHPSQSSQAGQNWPAAPSAAQTLEDRLQAVASAQEARGSASTHSSGSNPQVPGNVARGSLHTVTTASSNSGSGGYLGPVNTLSSGQHAYMSNARHQLPTGGQMISGYPAAGGSVPHFDTPDYEIENPLATTMSNMSVAVSPGERPGAAQSSYFDYYGNQNPGRAYGGSYGSGETGPVRNPSGPYAGYSMSAQPQIDSVDRQSYFPDSQANRGAGTYSDSQFGEPLNRVNAKAYTASSSSPSSEPAPVARTATYNPSYDAQERTPSTGSASSNFGAPLAQAPRNPSPPPEAPAPVKSSSSGHGHSGKKKKETKAPSGVLAWMAGAQQKKKPGGHGK